MTPTQEVAERVAQALGISRTDARRLVLDEHILHRWCEGGRMLTETAKCRRTLVAGVNRGTTQVTPAGGGVVIKTTPGPYARMLDGAWHVRCSADGAIGLELFGVWTP